MFRLETLTLNPKERKSNYLFADYVEGGKVSVSFGTIKPLGTAIGIDPGVNFGVTIINEDEVQVINGKLRKQESSLAYSVMAQGMSECLLEMLPAMCNVLEGPAFNKVFGQVGLADVRAGFYLGFKPRYPIIVPPMTCRKEVFDNGKTQAGEVWPNIDHNAADSLALALYGLLHPQVRTNPDYQDGR